MKNWLLNMFDLGWPLVILGVVWLYVVPELIGSWGTDSGIRSIMDSIGKPDEEAPSLVLILLPILGSLLAYLAGFAAIAVGLWKMFR